MSREIFKTVWRKSLFCFANQTANSVWNYPEQVSTAMFINEILLCSATGFQAGS